MTQGRMILVVEDEEKISSLVRLYLEKEGFNVAVLNDGYRAVRYLKEGRPCDLIILDLMLPGMDGWEVLRQVRQRSNLPVIVLTARGDEIDRVLGLEMGADDYVVKPFSPRELVARVKAVLRRSEVGRAGSEEQSEVIRYPHLIINAAARQVEVDGELISLTPKEFDLLFFLARSPGRVFSREQLLNQVWGYDFVGEPRTVDTHITRLREKLGRRSEVARYIQTVWGIGYKFEVGRSE